MPMRPIETTENEVQLNGNVYSITTDTKGYVKMTLLVPIHEAIRNAPHLLGSYGQDVKLVVNEVLM